MGKTLVDDALQLLQVLLRIAGSSQGYVLHSYCRPRSKMHGEKVTILGGRTALEYTNVRILELGSSN